VTGKRDRAIERLLQQTQPPSAGLASDMCLDPETVAAWTDGTLTSDERRMAEAHAAACGRCQAVLAAMAQTQPVAASPRPAWWRKPAIRWLVPLAAAEIGLLVWIFVAPRGQPAVAIPVEPSVAAVRSQPPATPAPEPAAAPARDLQKAPVAAPGAAKAAPAAQANAGADAAQSRAAFDELAAPVGEMARRNALAAPLLVIPSPAAASAWRLTSDGGIERTVDGATWVRQDVGPPVSVSAGASPSRDVVWMVGANGLVLLSTDGRTWQRRNLGEAVQLIAVRPADALTATVTTADGRAFVTHDAGLTWARVPLQENPPAPFKR
jgi:hypothetical protein